MTKDELKRPFTYLGVPYENECEGANGVELANRTKYSFCKTANQNSVYTQKRTLRNSPHEIP